MVGHFMVNLSLYEIMYKSVVFILKEAPIRILYRTLTCTSWSFQAADGFTEDCVERSRLPKALANQNTCLWHRVFWLAAGLLWTGGDAGDTGVFAAHSMAMWALNKVKRKANWNVNVICQYISPKYTQSISINAKCNNHSWDNPI